MTEKLSPKTELSSTPKSRLTRLGKIATSATLLATFITGVHATSEKNKDIPSHLKNSQNITEQFYDSPADNPDYDGVADPPTPEQAQAQMGSISNLDSLAQKGWSNDEISAIETQLLAQIASKNPGYDYYSLVLVSPDYYYQIVNDNYKIKIGFVPITPATPENPNGEIQDTIPSISFFATLSKTDTGVTVTVSEPEIIYP